MRRNTEEGNYIEIIDLPHHTSSTRPRMSVQDRAAQFSPFAALTGYDAAVKETARLTDQRIELDEYEKALLDEKLQIVQEHLKDSVEVTITYFLPDARKTGGKYILYTGGVKKIDRYERTLVMMEGIKIPIEDIIEVEFNRN